MSSTILEPDPAAASWTEPEEEALGGLGCAAMASGATAITFGLALLCMIVYGSRTDPFGATSLIALAWIGLGLAALVSTAVLGLGYRLLRREWRAASMTAFALGVAALLCLVANRWLRVPALESAWLLAMIVFLITLAAVVSIARRISRPSVAALLAVALSGTLFGWGVESRLDVDIVWNTSPMRAAAAREVLMFEASESGDYEVRHGDGGCLRGNPIAIGSIGPGWEETDEPPGMVEVALGDSGLIEGENVVFVCVRHGIASGEAQSIVVVDDTRPAKATIDVQPTTQIGGEADHRVAATRSLRFSGTFDGTGRPTLEINGLPLDNHGPGLDVVDGRWSIDWTLSPTTDQSAFGVVVEDEAGNATRSEMIHVRFVGIDPPSVSLEQYLGLRVDCRGEPALDGDDCRAWAAATFVVHPELLTDAARVLLALPNRFGDCAAETRAPDDFTLLRLAIRCPEH